MSEGGHEDAFIGQNEGEFEDGTVLEDLNENDRGKQSSETVCIERSRRCRVSDEHARRACKANARAMKARTLQSRRENRRAEQQTCPKSFRGVIRYRVPCLRDLKGFHLRRCRRRGRR